MNVHPPSRQEIVRYLCGELADEEALEIALIENLQRQDLTALEEADGYKQLIDKFGHTQEKLAQQLGKSRSHIANMMRLLALPGEVKAMLEEGLISAGHARALLSLESRSEMIQLRNEIVKKDLSVRAAERKANQMKKGAERTRKASTEPDPYLKEIAQRLTEHFGYRVTVTRNEKKGAIQFEFYSDDDLERLLALLKG